MDEDTDDPVVPPVFQKLKQPRGVVLHLYRVLGWSPALVKAWGPFAWALRFDLTASRRLRKLLVIHIARHLGAHYAYGHHLHMALDEGIPQAQVDALSSWRSSNLFDADEPLMLQLGDELAISPGAGAGTMAALVERFGEKEAVELLVTGAFYCGVARIVNSLDLALEPNADAVGQSNASNPPQSSQTRTD